MQIVDNDHKNNLMKFEKIQHSIFEYFNGEVFFRPIEINGNLYFAQN